MSHRPAPAPHRRRAGVTLIELLCVMAIIAILVSMLLGPVGRAYRKARGVAGAVQTANTDRIVGEIQLRYSTYRLQHPAHPELNLPGFVQACGLSAEAEAWLRLRPVTFHPFAGNAAPDTPVIETTRSGATPHAIWRLIDLLVPVSPP